MAPKRIKFRRRTFKKFAKKKNKLVSWKNLKNFFGVKPFFRKFSIPIPIYVIIGANTNTGVYTISGTGSPKNYTQLYTLLQLDYAFQRMAVEYSMFCVKGFNVKVDSVTSFNGTFPSGVISNTYASFTCLPDLFINIRLPELGTLSNTLVSYCNRTMRVRGMDTSSVNRSQVYTLPSVMISHDGQTPGVTQVYGSKVWIGLKQFLDNYDSPNTNQPCLCIGQQQNVELTEALSVANDTWLKAFQVSLEVLCVFASDWVSTIAP